jgi:hypothetical protein
MLLSLQLRVLLQRQLPEQLLNLPALWLQEALYLIICLPVTGPSIREQSPEQVSLQLSQVLQQELITSQLQTLQDVLHHHQQMLLLILSLQHLQSRLSEL